MLTVKWGFLILGAVCTASHRRGVQVECKANAKKNCTSGCKLVPTKVIFHLPYGVFCVGSAVQLPPPATYDLGLLVHTVSDGAQRGVVAARVGLLWGQRPVEGASRGKAGGGPKLAG